MGFSSMRKQRVAEFGQSSPDEGGSTVDHDCHAQIFSQREVPRGQKTRIQPAVSGKIRDIIIVENTEPHILLYRSHHTLCRLLTEEAALSNAPGDGDSDFYEFLRGCPKPAAACSG